MAKLPKDLSQPFEYSEQQSYKKYPTLRVRVTQEQFDKAYRNGWPESVKKFINETKENQND